MKVIASLLGTAAIVSFTACSSGSGDAKKVVVFSSGKMQVDPNSKEISFEPGNQHNEQTIELAKDVKTVTVKSPAGNKSYDVPDDGTYLLNLKSDTLIGNLVNFGSSNLPASIDAEQLQNMIDSTQQLLVGQNASDEKKTYFLPPNSIKKVSANTNAQLLSPFKNIPYKVEADKDGKAPEMYKFFTNKQKREALDELIQRLKK